MQQLFVPGGSCTRNFGLLTFQATTHPASQPWQVPIAAVGICNTRIPAQELTTIC